jgi:hypothetical protein
MTKCILCRIRLKWWKTYSYFKTDIGWLCGECNDRMRGFLPGEARGLTLLFWVVGYCVKFVRYLKRLMGGK